MGRGGPHGIDLEVRGREADEHADGAAEPEVGAVPGGLGALEGDTRGPDLHVLGADPGGEELRGDDGLGRGGGGCPGGGGVGAG